MLPPSALESPRPCSSLLPLTVSGYEQFSLRRPHSLPLRLPATTTTTQTSDHRNACFSVTVALDKLSDKMAGRARPHQHRSSRTVETGNCVRPRSLIRPFAASPQDQACAAMLTIAATYGAVADRVPARTKNGSAAVDLVMRSQTLSLCLGRTGPGPESVMDDMPAKARDSLILVSDHRTRSCFTRSRIFVSSFPTHVFRPPSHTWA